MPNAVFSVSVGRNLNRNAAIPTHQIIRLNGREVWRRTQPGNQDFAEKVTIPLRDYTGQCLAIELAADCGDRGNCQNVNQCFWGQPQLVRLTGE